MNLDHVEIIENFDKWKDTLHKAIHVSEKVGMSEDTTTDIAKKVGDFLLRNVDSENPQQRLLKELWESGTQEERHSLAHMLINMIEHEYHDVQ